MKRTVITPDDLHEDDFVIEANKVRVKALAESARSEYVATFGEKIESAGDTPKPSDRLATIQNGFGIITLDFKETFGYRGNLIATLPDDCPTPAHFIQVQTDLGEVIYIEAGSREIKSERGLLLGKRYVVTMVGFFD